MMEIEYSEELEKLMAKFKKDLERFKKRNISTRTPALTNREQDFKVEK